MKVLAITAGRKLGNTEILAKEALMAAEELGAEVQMINLHDVDIKPCTGCEVCVMKVTKGERPECVVHKGKDDMERIMQAMLQAKGIIIAVPTFELQPAGIYKVFTDRFLPYEVAFLFEAKMIEKVPERVAGLITAGGSTQTWMTMTLPCLYTSMFTQSIKVVDQIMATGVGRPGHVLLKKNALAQARKLGQNVVQAIRSPWNEIKWLGEDPGWCPICHSNLLLRGKPRWDGECYPVECAVCAAGGTLRIEGEQVTFVVDQKSLRTHRLDSDTRNDHFYEIKNQMNEFFSNVETVQAKLGKYRDYKVRGLD